MTELRDIGHYRVEAHLGGGRYADTYQAVDTVRRRMVALKVLKTDALPGTISLSRFLEQAQLASDLIHPYIAWVWETGEVDGLYYLAERYVNGPSLATLLIETGPLPWEEALQAIQQVAQGLDFAHARGWVHADVKPQNILLSPDLGTVLTDLGLMHALQMADFPPGSGPPIGTAQYIPPEVWEGGVFQPASDQYALACTLVEALTIQTLFDAPTTLEIMTRHQATLQLPAVWPVQVPWGLNDVFERALAKDPAQRYASVGDFADAVEMLTLETGQDPEKHALRNAEARAWREAQEQSRKQGEEAARLAALEQARREIQEQLRREAEMRADQEAAPLGDDLSLEGVAAGEQAQRPLSRRRKERRRSSWRRRWLLWVGVGLALVVLVGLWLSGGISANLFGQDTPTPTEPPPTATFTATHTMTTTATATPTWTPSASPTATATHTPTRTPAPTSTATDTPTPTRTRIPTNTPGGGSDRESSASGGSNP